MSSRRSFADRSRPAAVEWLEGRTLLSVELVADLIPGPTGSGPHSLTPFRDEVYFSASQPGGPNGGSKSVMFRSDGTAAGTRRFFGGTSPLESLEFFGGVELNGELLFMGHHTSTRGGGLWATDGTEAGTRLVKDVSGAGRPVESWQPTRHGGYVYFLGQADDEITGGLWRSDGTEAGTVQLLPYGPYPRHWHLIGGANGRFLFIASTAAGGSELWSTDGTPQGTTQLTDLQPGAVDGVLNHRSYVFGDAVYFLGWDGVTYDGLWKTDGTPAGTTLVQPGYRVSGGAPIPYVGPMYVHEGLLYYNRAEHLWRTDGTPAGTEEWATLPYGTFVGGIGLWRGDIYLSTHRVRGPQAVILYKSDGTAAGTTALKDGAGGDRAVDMGDTLLFTAGMWRTDGTSAGTLPEGAASPRPAVKLGGEVLLVATSDAHGQELFKWTSAPITPSVAARHVFYNNSAFDGRDPAPTAADDNAIAPDKQPLLPHYVARDWHATSYVRGINGVMVDVRNLPGGGANVSAADFSIEVGTAVPGPFDRPAVAWRTGPAPAAVAVRRGAGVDGSDRITLTFPDGTARDGWLRVTVKPTPGTGLLRADVFAIGNLVGESFDISGTVDPVVNAIDLAATRAARPSAATLSSRVDFDRDGRVTALDLATARARQRNRLAMTASIPIPSTLVHATVQRVWEDADGEA